jgi:hypothetical protein
MSISLARAWGSPGRVVLGFGLALGSILSLSSSAWAQAPTPAAAASQSATSGGQGPRFPFVGPSAAPPDSEGAARDTSSLPPGRSARCRWDLRGVWESRGRQTDPTANSYSGTLNVRQYGNYLIVERSSDSLTYYGVCSGDRVELDAYSGDQFVGAYTGTVSANGRRAEGTWVLYSPDYRAGYETLSATATPTTR